ncbi:MAG TPA: hypothetical protein VLJ61_00955 [Pyrinomonadaceae bacterium]|nr:hypothetical protein [Pyrinomonadaceae bacterium]
MTRESSIRLRHAPATPAREELKRRLLALVLAAVLLWYTSLVVPSNVRPRAARPHEDDERGGEVRGLTGASEAERVATDSTAKEGALEQVEELDWPEYICLD